MKNIILECKNLVFENIYILILPIPVFFMVGFYLLSPSKDFYSISIVRTAAPLFRDDGLIKSVLSNSLERRDPTEQYFEYESLKSEVASFPDYFRGYPADASNVAPAAAMAVNQMSNPDWYKSNLNYLYTFTKVESRDLITSPSLSVTTRNNFRGVTLVFSGEGGTVPVKEVGISGAKLFMVAYDYRGYRKVLSFWSSLMVKNKNSYLEELPKYKADLEKNIQDIGNIKKLISQFPSEKIDQVLINGDKVDPTKFLGLKAQLIIAERLNFQIQESIKNTKKMIDICDRLGMTFDKIDLDLASGKYKENMGHVISDQISEIIKGESPDSYEAINILSGLSTDIQAYDQFRKKYISIQGGRNYVKDKFSSVVMGIFTSILGVILSIFTLFWLKNRRTREK